MKEFLDVRANGEWVQSEFGDALGEPMRPPRTGNKEHDEEFDRLFGPFPRRIVLSIDDPRIPELARRIIDAEIEFPDRNICGAVGIIRKYRQAELADAELLQLRFMRMFEPCGEDMGTDYDETNACPKCGYGRVQCSPLRLNLNKVPKNAHLAMTIARDEWIVSGRLAELMSRRRVSSEDKLSGFRLEPVEHQGRKPPVQRWFQLIVTGSAGHVAPPSRFAIDYIRDDVEGRFACEAHALSGLNLVSEAYLKRGDVEAVDLAVTTNREGLCSGVVRPTPILVISPRYYRLLREHKIKGYKVEVAHLVD